MSEPFLAEIRVFGFNFAPRNWAMCDGQILPISQNTALFSLIGTFYGGNGTSNFGLPNIQGSAVIGVGQGNGLSNYDIGQTGGVQTVTLIQSEMPMHSHAPNCDINNGDQTSPAANIWGKAHVGRTPVPAYAPATDSTMNPLAISPTGNSFPHNNMPPYITMNFCICISGIFPQRP